LPNANSDGNRGYECDENSGIAKTNPAHTGCQGGGDDDDDGGGGGQNRNRGDDDDDDDGEQQVVAAVTPAQPSAEPELGVAEQVEQVPSRERGEVPAGQRFVARRLPFTGLEAWLLAMLGAAAVLMASPASGPREGLCNGPRSRIGASNVAPIFAAVPCPWGGEFRPPIAFRRRWTTNAPRSWSSRTTPPPATSWPTT
jgi:hypothetical protein